MTWINTGNIMGKKVKIVSRSVISNSLWPQGLQPARLLCPWDSPGKNTGVGSHSLLPGISPSQWLNPSLLHCRKILYCLSRLYQKATYYMKYMKCWKQANSYWKKANKPLLEDAGRENWDRLLKQRHYFADKGPSSQGYCFSSGHVWMWELDYKESWALKNWCF